MPVEMADQVLKRSKKRKRELKIMPVEMADQVVNRSKKRKRSRESQQRNGLKETNEKDCTSPSAAKKMKGPVGPELTGKQKRNPQKNSSKKNKYKHLALNKSSGAGNNGLKEKTVVDGDCEKDGTSPPTTKKLKGPVGPELTRKQRRNQKKNSSKKNKYKHLALNKSNGEGDKAGASSCSVTGHEIMDKKKAAVDSGSKSVSGKSKPQKTKSHSKERGRRLSQPSQKLVSSVQTPATSLKRKKKGKAKFQKEEESMKPSHLLDETDLPEMSDFDEDDDEDDDDDDDDSTQKTFDHENNNRHRESSASESAGTGGETSQKETLSKKKKTKTESALDKARDKLNAARFRYLNEQLYTSTGAEALSIFQQDPDAFQVYHQGFQHQVAQWPLNPLDVIIKQISTMPKSTVVADFGCGEARLAESLPHNVVHSFDLVSTKPCVTACDISKVPLDNSSVNVAVFCLSLMGTNLSHYLCEANRVLHNGGLLKIAEVVSRFYGVSRFVKNVEAIGFQMQKKTFLDKMFMMFTFKKVKDTSRKHAPRIQLKACYYKRR